MAETNDQATEMLRKLRQRRWVAVLVAAAAVVTGVEATTSAVTKLVAPVIAFLVPADRPVVAQFALIEPSAYRETQERFAFAGNGDPLVTYSPNPKAQPGLMGQPVFQVSIQNRADSPILVTEVAYHVREIGMVGLGPGRLIAQGPPYVHTLEYRTGTQKHKLVEPFEIPGKSHGAFELLLKTDYPQVGLCWLMEAEFITTKGPARTGEFQLVLSGDPDWARGL